MSLILMLTECLNFWKAPRIKLPLKKRLFQNENLHLQEKTGVVGFRVILLMILNISYTKSIKYTLFMLENHK